MQARIVRNDSKQDMNEFVLTGSTGNSACEPNDGARSADALTGTPALVPLGMHDQERSSPVNNSARSQSPSIDGNGIGSDQEDQ
jgi:hypothetical protein